MYLCWYDEWSDIEEIEMFKGNLDIDSVWAWDRKTFPKSKCVEIDVSFAPIQQDFGAANTVPCSKPRMDKTMYIENDKKIESAKLNYLIERATTLFYNREMPMMRQFGLCDDDAPKSTSEYVKRIQDGKFVYRDESKKDYEGAYYRPNEGIRWRDPAVKEDKAGYKAAWDAYTKVFLDTKDAIIVGTPAEGLAAIKALEAWTPTVVAA